MIHIEVCMLTWFTCSEDMFLELWWDELGFGLQWLAASPTAWQFVFCCFCCFACVFLLASVLLGHIYIFVLCFKWFESHVCYTLNNRDERIMSHVFSLLLSSLWSLFLNTSTHTQTEDLTWLSQAPSLQQTPTFCSGEMSGEWTLALHLLSVGCLSFGDKNWSDLSGHDVFVSTFPVENEMWCGEYVEDTLKQNHYIRFVFHHT